MWKIIDLYKALTPNVHLLPVNTNYIWWSEYEENAAVFDRAFARMYANFSFNPLFNDDPEADVSFFNMDVLALFAKNAKKYEELYRLHVIQDSDLPLSYNYDMKEIMARQTSDQGAITSGQRTDVDNLQVGNQKNTEVNKVTAFNSASENTSDSTASEIGTRNDIRQFTKGQETDTSQSAGTENYTLTRKGNIGVQTGADIARIFMNLWTDERAVFYNTIFADICKELLVLE